MQLPATEHAQITALVTMDTLHSLQTTWKQCVSHKKCQKLMSDYGDIEKILSSVNLSLSGNHIRTKEKS